MSSQGFSHLPSRSRLPCFECRFPLPSPNTAPAVPGCPGDPQRGQRQQGSSVGAPDCPPLPSGLSPCRGITFLDLSKPEAICLLLSWENIPLLSLCRNQGCDFLPAERSGSVCQSNTGARGSLGPTGQGMVPAWPWAPASWAEVVTLPRRHGDGTAAAASCNAPSPFLPQQGRPQG